ncbi:3-hexulose-6-phosphate synthase [groundwater metagenome]|uniref:3-hexulose-6-phosphate synthase n=1 Tax=groundwater metagenome TaxID=717931 RepID=A0A098E629_9ZZZZ
MKAKLQLALDFVELERAINIAKEAENFVDMLEVGTPLIKSEGMNAVRKFRKDFPDKEICADMKTMDVGRTEVEMAAKAGADIVGILGASDYSMLFECLKAGRNYGCKIMVDMLNVENLMEKAKKIQEFAPEAYICVHLGIDQQMKGMKISQEVEKLAKAGINNIAVAGGINSENVGELAKFCTLIIVGAAITKSRNVAESAGKLKEAIEKEISIKSEFRKASSEDEILEIFKKVSTANISDAMHRAQVMNDIKPFKPGMKVIGKAFTVRTFSGDWAKAVESINKAKAGNVIVIDANGKSPAVWGELATLSCIQKGIKGVVIDGAIRDIKEISKLNFPAFVKLITSNAGEPKGFGELDVKISCGGVDVRPGDYIIGDDDGVIVVPEEDAIEVANRALDVYEKEDRIKEEIGNKSTLASVAEIEKWESCKR